MYVYLLSMYRMYIVLMEILMELCERACEIIKMFSFYVITEQVMKLTKGNKKTSPQYLFYDNKFYYIITKTQFSISVFKSCLLSSIISSLES